MKRRNAELHRVELRCAKCELWKPLEEFWRSAKTKSGRASWCKTCTSDTYELRRKRRRKVSPISIAERLREKRWRKRLIELRKPVEQTLRPKLDIVRLIGRPYQPQRECFG